MKDRGWNSHLQRLKREGRWERGVGMVKRGDWGQFKRCWDLGT